MFTSQIRGRATQRGQNVKWTKVHIFKPQYLPQMGPDSPLSKNIFFHSPNGSKLKVDQSTQFCTHFSQGPQGYNVHESDRGQAAQRSQNVKWTKVHMEAIAGPYGQKLGKNGRLRGHRGKTGSRNMAANQKIDFLTLVSYSLPNTFGSLSRTVTELYWLNVTIKPL